MTRTSLFTSTSSTIISGIIQLADDITNYDDLEFIFCAENSSNNKYMLQAKEAVAEYRKNLSPESYELAEEIDDLVILH